MLSCGQCTIGLYQLMLLRWPWLCLTVTRSAKHVWFIFQAPLPLWCERRISSLDSCMCRLLKLLFFFSWVEILYVNMPWNSVTECSQGYMIGKDEIFDPMAGNLWGEVFQSGCNQNLSRVSIFVLIKVIEASCSMANWVDIAVKMLKKHSKERNTSCFSWTMIKNFLFPGQPQGPGTFAANKPAPRLRKS